MHVRLGNCGLFTALVFIACSFRASNKGLTCRWKHKRFDDYLFERSTVFAKTLARFFSPY